ncbi:SHOCT domain-containing protein [Actinoplanes sp. CA-015351]|uniref:SHOCT domain-containing protein n=1 Tax=Actinoplanes sp. CA-015351 TaxID=3239897 RepID=UPI003D96DFD7
MGLFAEKGDARARAERARGRAAQAGIDVAGALAVGHMVDGGASVYLLVFPDRLELVSTGQMGFRTGAGRSVIALGDISGVSVRDGLIRGVLLVALGGNTVEFSTDKALAGHLCQVIEERLAAGPVENPLLRNLAELHAAGLLTDAEYEEKRAGLL